MEKEEIVIAGIYSSASNLNSFILLSAGFLIILVCLRLFSINVVKIPKTEIEIPRSKIWIVLILYTIGHLYFAFILNQRINKFESEAPKTLKKEIVWRNIVDGDKGGFIFDGMEKRIKTSQRNFLGLTVYSMSKTDITTWISIGITFLLFFSVVDFKGSKQQIFLTAYVGLLLCIINWTIGGWWAISVSKFAP